MNGRKYYKLLDVNLKKQKMVMEERDSSLEKKQKCNDDPASWKLYQTIKETQ